MRAHRIVLVALAAALFATPAAAGDIDPSHPWDATWFGGFENGGDGVQIIVAGDAVIGFFFHNDYIDVSESDPIAADGSLTFTWDGGEATLSASGDDRSLTIHPKDAAAIVIPLKQDE